MFCVNFPFNKGRHHQKNCPTFFHVVFILGIEFINMNDSEILEISQKFPSFGGGGGGLKAQKNSFLKFSLPT